MDNCPNNYGTNNSGGNLVKGTIGIQLGGAVEIGTPFGGAAGQLSAAIVVSSDGKGKLGVDLQVTGGGMAGENNKKQGVLGGSAGATVSGLVSNAGKTSDLLDKATTTSTSVGPVGASVSTSGSTVTTTVGGGIKGGGVSSSSYETNTISIPQKIKSGVDTVKGWFSPKNPKEKN